ncbi:MAG: lysophospholipid acyltransferase family protein [Myxococcota bacterium]
MPETIPLTEFEGTGVTAWLGRWWLKTNGWSMAGRIPEPRRFVLIAAPHTSNWDLPYMLAIGWVYGIRVRWMGKHTLFGPPFGWLMRKVGGVPIDRRAPHGVVAQMAERFAQADELMLAVPPEGTRSKREYWKSGFYEIAKAAGVPIVLGYLDFGNKVGGMGPPLVPTGDVVADMDVIREFYREKSGHRPAEFTQPRLRSEEPSGD